MSKLRIKDLWGFGIYPLSCSLFIKGKKLMICCLDAAAWWMIQIDYENKTIYSENFVLKPKRIKITKRVIVNE